MAKFRSVSPAAAQDIAIRVPFAEQNGRTLLELAFSWLLRVPTVASVIAGATTSDQIRANANAAGWEISKEDLAQIDRAAGG